jgi:hypothetical protein
MQSLNLRFIFRLRDGRTAADSVCRQAMIAVAAEAVLCLVSIFIGLREKKRRSGWERFAACGTRKPSIRARRFE